MPRSSVKNDFDVIVVGGGFCGVWTLHRLRKLGFNVRLFEAGSALGGIWHWNCYPGARVDTYVPAYQLTDPETWQDWDWKQRFPSQPELLSYFEHLDKVWHLSKDVSYNSRVTSLTWNKDEANWMFKVNGENAQTAHSVILCTGFASKRFLPDWPGMGDFEGRLQHTAVWPQSNIDLKGKKVAVIGTGASGIQVIQEAAKDASHLTVFQRTPNFALPMRNDIIDADKNIYYRTNWADTKHILETSFAGVPFNFQPDDPYAMSIEQRSAVYDKLYHTGGLTFWMANFKEMLFDENLNEEAYQFWRTKTLPRINNERDREILAPEKKPHPFGVKRISLEQDFFEIFNKPTAQIISTKQEPITNFTKTGIQTKDNHYDFDVIILATGFDSITGGITQIPIVGTDPNFTIAQNWQQGTRTYFGMASHGFPNLFFTYGPQAPTAFASGPAAAETQGKWIAECLQYMRDHGLTTIEAQRSAEEEWGKHVNDIANMSLLPLTDSWYMGTNVPGKKKESLNYLGGMPLYREKIRACAEDGYAGFVLE